MLALKEAEADSHDNNPSQTYLARVDAAITPPARAMRWLEVISGVLEDVA